MSESLSLPDLERLRNMWTELMLKRQCRKLCETMVEWKGCHLPQLDKLFDECIVTLAQAVTQPHYLHHRPVSDLSHLAVIFAGTKFTESYQLVCQAIRIASWQRFQ